MKRIPRERKFTGGRRRPSETILREVMSLYDSGWTQQELAQKYCMSQTGISKWITTFAKELENPDMRKKSLKPTKSKNKAKRIVGIAAPEESGSESVVGNVESAEEKIKRLERELADARLARDFYNEMINVAERQFNINIRKKAGTRQ